MQEVRKPSFTSPPAGDRLRSFARATSTQRCSRGGGEDRVGDQRGAQAVGERRHPFGSASRSGRPRRSRPRTRRSSPRSPGGGRRGGTRSARPAGESVAGSRRTIAQLPRDARTRALRGCSWSKASASLGAVELDPEPVLAARRDLADDDRADRAGVGLELDDGGVLGGDRCAPSPPSPPASNARRPVALTRSGTAVSSRAERRTMRWPDTNSARSHQCEPMSANARDGAAQLARPRASCRRRGAGASPAGRCRGAGAARRSRPLRDALARLAHRRVVAVDERHRRRAVPTRPRRRRGAARRAASSASGFSQITCLPAASAASASGTCRWFGVQMCTTSTSGSRTSSSAESKAAIRAELGGRSLGRFR